MPSSLRLDKKAYREIGGTGGPAGAIGSDSGAAAVRRRGRLRHTAS